MKSQQLVIPGRQPDEKFIRVVRDVLSPRECEEWIAFAERLVFLPASLVDSDNPQTATKVKNPHRTNDRVLTMDPDKSKLLFERLRPFLPAKWTGEDQGNWQLASINDRLSFLRYQNAEHYGRHVDVPYEDQKTGCRSFITCQLYLNDGFLGGATRFDQEVGYTRYDERSHLDVVPVTGSALLFEHELTHEGRPVTSGVKYSVRTDAMYCPVWPAPNAPATSGTCDISACNA